MTRQLNFRRHVFARVASRVVLLAIGLSAGCANAAPPTTAATHPATRPTTQATGQLRMNDAVPLEAIQSPGTQVDFASKFSTPQARGTLYFGTVSPSADEGDSVALIAFKIGDRIKAIKIEDERISDAQWMFTGAGPALGELWGVLDDSGSSPAADLVLVHSIDGGATWQVSAIHKPNSQADFSEFAMDRTGHGRLSLYLSADCGDDDAPADGKQRRRRRAKREPVRAGSYHFRTADGGKTWAMQFEPDAMTPGEDVPEDEQPGKHSLAGYFRKKSQN